MNQLFSDCRILHSVFYLLVIHYIASLVCSEVVSYFLRPRWQNYYTHNRITKVIIRSIVKQILISIGSSWILINASDLIKNVLTERASDLLSDISLWHKCGMLILITILSWISLVKTIFLTTGDMHLYTCTFQFFTYEKCEKLYYAVNYCIFLLMRELSCWH